MKAAYEVVAVTPDKVVIRDLGLECRKSVTNDADRVVAELVAHHGDRRIFYYDSAGDYAELVHAAGVFRDFGFAEEGES